MPSSVQRQEQHMNTHMGVIDMVKEISTDDCFARCPQKSRSDCRRTLKCFIETFNIASVLPQSLVPIAVTIIIAQSLYSLLRMLRTGEIEDGSNIHACSLQARLTKEMSERDAEAALYSTRLYESERHLSDWRYLVCINGFFPVEQGFSLAVEYLWDLK
eukprot:259983-Pelagomonas_calceolata.AAC.1